LSKILIREKYGCLAREMVKGLWSAGKSTELKSANRNALAALWMPEIHVISFLTGHGLCIERHWPFNTQTMHIMEFNF
jgi:hypothetical protein